MQIPYGESNFRKVAIGDYYYIDKTQFIEKLEYSDEAFIFFLRPRRFGKSLFISMLEYYYGVQYKAEFEQMFGNLHIGKNPTPKANSYLILKFDFSGIETDSYKSAENGFLRNVQDGINTFFNQYDHFFALEDKQLINESKSANECIKTFFSIYKNRNVDTPIYLLIDEYDHFANNLLAFRYDDFTKSTTAGGFVRTFYEVLKTNTGSGIINRIFITGVTPITLDSLTSGFNICSNRSTNVLLNEMHGFTEEEVKNLISRVGNDRKFIGFDIEKIINDLRLWYNGYLFNRNAKNRVYNSDMILYFTKEFSKNAFQVYPDSIIDINVASDYRKIQMLFNIKNKELNYTTLDELISKDEVSANLTELFNLQMGFTRDDFISMLFYMGFVSIKGTNMGAILFSPPNYVIRILFYEYFFSLIAKHTTVPITDINIHAIVLELAQNNNIRPLIELIENTLRNTSNRDFMQFDEKHIKLLFIAYANAAKFYYIKSEPEVNRNYPDLMLLFRPPFFPNYQFLFEFKYAKAKSKRQKGSKQKAEGEAQSIAQLKQEATEQLLRYAHTPETREFIGTEGGGMKTVKGYIVIFCGDKADVVEEVQLTQ